MAKQSDQDIQNVQSYYNSRAATYDDSFHPQQAADYIDYVAPQKGEAWLDLACGTGLVTLLAAKAVGPEGKVIGIDIAQGMLDRAIVKAADGGLSGQVKFIQRDITDLSGLEAEGVVPGSFDIITCCSALPMAKNIDNTLRHWVDYLKPGGRLVCDVPSTRSLLNTGAFPKIAPLCGLEGEIFDDRGWIRSVDSLGEKLELAGLKCERAFLSRGYGSRVYKRDELESWFEKTVAVPIFAPYRAKGRRDVARREWLREMRAMADEHGDVQESMSFFVGVGFKPS